MALNSRRLLAVVVLALLVALALALPVSATDKKFVPPKKHVTTLETVLTGEQEVPGPGDRDGVGRAVVKVFKTKVCYTLKVERIAPATAAHIHLGLRGEAGPVVATLKPPTDGSSRACTEIPRALSLELIEHPARYYVNVHNDPFPDGAIRGQLHR
jgi:CHRD domain